MGPPPLLPHMGQHVDPSAAARYGTHGACGGGYRNGSASHSGAPQRSDGDHLPARKSAKAAVEVMIGDYRLSPNIAWMLRSLSPAKLKEAAMIDPAGQQDPSRYIEEQLILKQLVNMTSD